MHVEIWSDVVCPWCAIGKRRFETALSRFPHADAVEVTWRSYELDPGAPRVRSEPAVEHLASKYGVAREEAQAMHDRMTGFAREEGLDFRLDTARSGNTFDAHRLLHLARERGVQDAVKERLLVAYLSEGEAIGDPDVLERLAAQAGLSAEEARAVLAADDYADAVRSDEATARSLGITGVPFFVVDRTHGVSGAQPAEVLLDLLNQIWASTQPVSMVGSDGSQGEACGDGTCTLD